MVTLFFCVLVSYASLSLFYIKQRRKINLFGTLFLSIISFLFVTNMVAKITLAWPLENIFLLDNSVTLAGKVSLLTISLFFLFLNVFEKKQDQVQISTATVVGNYILLFASGAVLFDSLLMFYFFYELAWLLLMFLLGLLLYREKGNTYRVLINILFGSTLFNIFCILSLSSWITPKQSFFNLSAQTLANMENIKPSEISIDLLVYVLIGVLILKTLFPIFYAAQLDSHQKKLQSYIFNIQVAVNTVLTVYVLTHFFKNHLNKILLEFAWIHATLPWVLILIGSFFVIRSKTNDNYFKSILFIYNVIFISGIILIAPINSKMVGLFTAHFLISFALINVINEILKERFGCQARWVPLGLKKTMPRFFLLLVVWLVVTCGFPWSGGNIVKMFYISKLASQPPFAIYFWGIFVFTFLLFFIPFILSVKKGETSKEVLEKFSDINIYEFSIISLLITAELVLGVGGQQL